MSMELIAIIGVGVTLAGLILIGQRYQREEIKTLREETLAGFKALREEINNLGGVLGTQYLIYLNSSAYDRGQVAQCTEPLILSIDVNCRV